MPLYLLLLDGRCFDQRIRPALADSWKQRRFEPCRSLCRELAPAAQAFGQQYHLDPNEMLVTRINHALPFDRTLWRHLAGEVLWLSAADIPDIQTTPETLGCLLGVRPPLRVGLDRSAWAPIEQAYFGTRDLRFGAACYRPAEAGYNCLEDVARLADYLANVNPGSWTPGLLEGLPGLEDEQDRAEELELVKEWLAPLQELYHRARQNNHIVISETIGG